MSTLRYVRHIAAQDLRDLVRQRGTWMTLLMFPIINVVLIVIVPGMLNQREQRQQQTTVYEVAVQADPAAFAAIRPVLSDARLRLRTAPSAEIAVRGKRAHAGLVIPRTIADAASNNLDEARFEVIALATRNASRAAVARLVTALEAYRAERVAARVRDRGLPASVIRPIEVRQVDLGGTARGGRLALARVLPLLLLLPLSGAVGLAAQRVSGGKDERVLEPLLVLPVNRSVILSGKAVAGYTLATITLPAIALPLLLGRTLPVGMAGRTVPLPFSSVLAIVGVAAVVLVALVAVGSCVGAAARTSSEMGSMLLFITLPIVLGALTLNFVTVRTSLPLAAIPVFGNALVARDVIAGAVRLDTVVINTLMTLVAAVALIVGASRFLERERSVLRPTS